MGRDGGGGLGVSMLASHSDNLSSNPAEACRFFCKLLLEKTNINKKRPGLTD